MTIWEILRVIVRSDGRLLTDAEWVAKAIEAIDHADPAAKKAAVAEPEPVSVADATSPASDALLAEIDALRAENEALRAGKEAP